MHRLLGLLAMAVGMVVLSAGASAERRVALVAGNSAYKHVPAVAKATGDARALAAALQRLGFEVIPAIDLGAAELRRALTDFATTVRGADVALVFYSGHAVQLDGENYLIPVDAAIATAADLDRQSVTLSTVWRHMDRPGLIKILMLDAGRANPFERAMPRGTARTRPGVPGKPPGGLDVAIGTLLVFSTEPGGVALEGKGRHSPFMEALLRHIETPGLEIGPMMRRVTREVHEATDEKQRPWVNASLTQEFYMKPQ